MLVQALAQSYIAQSVYCMYLPVDGDTTAFICIYSIIQLLELSNAAYTFVKCK